MQGGGGRGEHRGDYLRLGVKVLLNLPALLLPERPYEVGGRASGPQLPQLYKGLCQMALESHLVLTAYHSLS